MDGLRIDFRGVVRYEDKTLDWRRHPKSVRLLKHMLKYGESSIELMCLDVHHLDLSMLSGRYAESLHANMVKMVSRARADLEGAFGGRWLACKGTTYHLRLEEEEMVAVGGTLGDASQTDRAAAVELPTGTASAEERRVYLEVETWLRNNPGQGLRQAFGPLKINPAVYYRARKRMEDRGTFSKGDLLRPESPIVKNMKKQEREPEPEPPELEDTHAPALCPFCATAECPAATDPNSPCGPVDTPTDDGSHVYPEFDRRKHVVDEVNDALARGKIRIAPVAKELLDHNAILRDQLEYGRAQIVEEEGEPLTEPSLEDHEAALEPEEEPEPHTADQALVEVLAWLRPLTELEQKRVVVAAQVMLGIL